MTIKTEWSFDTLYKSTSDPIFINDFNTFQSLISSLTQYTESNFSNTHNSIKKIEDYIYILSDLSNYFKIANYLSLKVSANAKDVNSIKLLDKIEDLSSDLTKPFTSFIQFIKKIDNLDEIIASSDYLKQFSFFLTETKTNSKYILAESEEIIIDKLKINGANSFEKLRDNSVSSIKIDFEIHGEIKTLTFAEIRNLAYDNNQETRKLAFEAELNAYKNIDETVNSCLNSIKGWAITESNMRGYDSLLQKTLISSRMKKETFDALIYAITDNLPKLQPYFSHKANLLGHKNGLPFYDLFATVGTETFNFSYKEAMDSIIEIFSDFSIEISDFLKNAFDNGWIDAFPRENKRDGAFCSNIHQIKESRILSNFTGTFSDVSTLAHELGHAYHGDCLKDEHYLNSDYPMPIAETASIFFETVLMNSYLEKSTKDQKITLLDNSISDSLQVLIDIYSRFIFEDTFINERKKSTLSIEETCDIMKNSQIKAYGNGLDKNILHEYMWLAKPHYYSADYNYYNFPYAFGLLFSRGLYEKYKSSLDKNDFLVKYKHLLAQTGKNSLEDIAMLVDIDITKKDFWDNSISSVVDEINCFINLTK